MKKCGCSGCHCGGGEAAIEQGACGTGCGQDHNHEHDNGHDHAHGSGEISSLRQDVIAVTTAVVLAVAAFFTPIRGVQIGLYLAATLVAGLPIFWEGLKSIAKLRLEEMALMTIAVTAACIIGEFPEAMLVTVLFRLGEMLEDLAVTRSRREVEAITKIIPDQANLLAEDGTDSIVEAKDLLVGSRILVKSGERVPVDCTVTAGNSSVDTSSLTGESVAREVTAGDSLLSGSINLGGALTCETVSGWSDSTAAKIIDMVRDSAAQKGHTERLISRFARVYTPIVIAVAVLVAVVPPLLGLGDFSEWLSRALVLLVASCPCALVISIPLSFFAGIGASSKNGVLVKGSRYLEALAAADTVVFDKTGTLTTGALSVSAVYAAPGAEESQVLELAALCERYSNHPIAKAVVEAAGTAASTETVVSCEEITAYGMRVELEDGGELLCGGRRLMERYGIDASSLPQAGVYLAKNGALLGAVEVFDAPRDDAADTVRQLRELGITRTVMLTGDAPAAAERVRREIGLDAATAELLPQGKVTELGEIRSQAKGKVLYLGDGINDAPVLAAADAGIAMGMASDAAIETADVVLLGDRLGALPQAIRVARRVGGLARFNIAFALAVKALVFALALTGAADMWMAVFADVGVTVLSVLNATRALRFR